MLIAGPFASFNGQCTNLFARLPSIHCCGSPDFDGDGSPATDADIEAFFACLAGDCCPTCGSPDFNSDGDTGTDRDIEAFFRVLSGGSTLNYSAFVPGTLVFADGTSLNPSLNGAGVSYSARRLSS